jgi:hypothetical protein
MAALAKLERQAGECLRLIDVPALLPGTEDIFDRASTPTKYFEDWRDTTFTKIATECRQNHGAALKAYLERIVLAELMLLSLLATLHRLSLGTLLRAAMAL